MKNKKIVFLSILVIAFAILIFSSSSVEATTIITTSFPKDGGVIIGVQGSYYTSSKDAILNKINQYRKEACDNHYKDPRNPSRNLTFDDYVPIKWSYNLENIARVRATEADILEEHTRPNGYTPFSMYSNGIRSSAEVLAWNGSTGENAILDGIAQWYIEKDFWVNNNSNYITGHYEALINPNNTYVGIGSFWADGAYWGCIAGELSDGSNLDESKNPFTGPCIQAMDLSTSYISAIAVNDLTVYKKFSDSPYGAIKATVGDKEFVSLVFYGLNLTSSDSNIAEIQQKNYLITGKNLGNTTITAKAGNASTTFTVNVISPPTIYNKVDYANVYDFYYYIEKYPDIANAFSSDPNKALEHFVKNGMKEGRQAIESFDVKSYKNAYVDLRNSFGENLIDYYLHYINSGKKEGRSKTIGITSPIGSVTKYNNIDYSLVYDYEFYTKHNLDVKNLYGNDDIKVLEHFVNLGMKEGRQAKSTFNVSSYAYKYSDLRIAYKNNLDKYYMHYINTGNKEGRKATGTTSFQNFQTVLNGVNYSIVYDCNYYVSNYNDVKKIYKFDDENILAHFVNHGMKEGRQAIKTFDVKSYKNAYVDLRNSFGENIIDYYLHYIKFGKKEGRNKTIEIASPIGSVTKYNNVDYSLVYDYKFYTNHNLDIKKAYGDDDIKVLAHFVSNGMNEARQAKSTFNVKLYKNKYIDLNKTFGNNYKKYYLHYINNGYKEGRKGC